VLIDGMVYGSQQSNSSANGTITSPEIATLEGDQTGGGCIVVLPNSTARGPQPVLSNDQTNRSFGRFPDGYDNDNNCSDFLSQNTVTLSLASPVGANNIKVANIAGFSNGQKIIIGSGMNSETAVISMVGTAGGTKLGAATEAGARVISVSSATGFAAGQTITIDSNANFETAIIASVTTGRRRFGNATNGPTDSITVTVPLKYVHIADAQVSGSGITLVTPLGKAHDNGTSVAGDIPTPGLPNQYTGKSK